MEEWKDGCGEGEKEEEKERERESASERERAGWTEARRTRTSAFAGTENLAGNKNMDRATACSHCISLKYGGHIQLVSLCSTSNPRPPTIRSPPTSGSSPAGGGQCP